MLVRRFTPQFQQPTLGCFCVRLVCYLEEELRHLRQAWRIRKQGFVTFILLMRSS
jgi:hypothetical protein